jgi:hypothetical protein
MGRWRSFLTLLPFIVACVVLSGCGAAQTPGTVQLSLTAPVDGATVNVHGIVVLGTVRPKLAVVIMSGKRIRVINGTFKHPLVLRRRLTRIKVVARAAGYAGAATNISVRYAPLGGSRGQADDFASPHYEWFYARPFLIVGRTLNERAIVEAYDRLRLHPFTHRAALRALRHELSQLARRLVTVAHEQSKPDGNPSWDRWQRGWRFQQLIYRAAGRRVRAATGAGIDAQGQAPSAPTMSVPLAGNPASAREAEFVGGCSHSGANLAGCVCVYQQLVKRGFDSQGQWVALARQWRRSFLSKGVIAYPPAFRAAIVSCAAELRG